MANPISCSTMITSSILFCNKIKKKIFQKKINTKKTLAYSCQLYKLAKRQKNGRKNIKKRDDRILKWNWNYKSQFCIMKAHYHKIVYFSFESAKKKERYPDAEKGHLRRNLYLLPITLLSPLPPPPHLHLFTLYQSHRWKINLPPFFNSPL